MCTIGNDNDCPSRGDFNMLTKYKFSVLVSIVFISGFAQGMLLPIIAVLLETNGTSSWMNGLNATALYAGILIASPFIEKPLRKFGYKPLILTGLLAVSAAFLLFPVWKLFWFWFVLRLVIGIGDHMLHFSTQTWITSNSPEDRRGRNISLYGIAFGSGFGIGPLMTKLLEYNEDLPFIAAGLLCLVSFVVMNTIKNDFPELAGSRESVSSMKERYGQVFKMAWPALLPPFGYGFLEATLHGTFPVYALRSGLSLDWVAILLPAFVIGSLVFQLPLGTLSDRYGRKPILLFCLSGGFVSFFLTSFARGEMWLYLTLFILAGVFVGSLFSLGIAYMSDILPKHLLPAGNILAGITFSLGSMAGPVIGGLSISSFGKQAFALPICVMLFVLFTAIILKKSSAAVPHKITKAG
ncbi:MFS transporter [Fictibacillus iocasae]|uniref:MFS transporter n=1 Tax=Fictibacillus iocasae TaxID=2715437 RepID=A0ABW2NW96_9BACL